MPGQSMTYTELASRGFQRIRVIPDVHGDLRGLHSSVAGASEDTFFVFLGDLTDRGDHNPAVLDMVCGMIEAGMATWTIGNHCWKLIRALKGRQVHYNPNGRGLGKTLRQIEAWPEKDDLVSRFLALAEKAPHWVHVGKYLFAHAAVHPDMEWRLEPHNEMEQLAMYGQTASRDANGKKIKTEDGMPVRIFDWCDLVSAGCHAIVGHQVMSREQPLHVENESGGLITFLDTGAGFSDGYLSHLDLPLPV